MDSVHLSAHQRQLIQRQLVRNNSLRQYRRLSGVLWLSEGRTITEVARLLRVSRQAIYDWIRAAEKDFNSFLHATRLKHGRPRRWTIAVDKALEQSLKKRPHDFGYLTPNWTIPLLRRHLHEKMGEDFSTTTLYRELRRLDYVWKRPRYRLIKDPEVGKKSDESALTYADCLSARSFSSKTKRTCASSRT